MYLLEDTVGNRLEEANITRHLGIVMLIHTRKPANAREHALSGGTLPVLNAEGSSDPRPADSIPVRLRQCPNPTKGIVPAPCSTPIGSGAEISLERATRNRRANGL